MKFMRWTFFSAAILLTVAQQVWAITPAINSVVNNVPINKASGTIERGGTITSIGPGKEAVTVDGVSYPFASSIRVAAADNLQAASQHKLRKGMRIRFITAKDTAGGKEKITEILIISRPPQN